MTTDYFKAKASNYDSAKHRVDNVQNIADCMLTTIKFNANMHVLDFGSGTGLLLERIAQYVEKITAVDISSSMNSQLREKLEDIDCHLNILEIDLNRTPIEIQVDGIISSMTLHHIDDCQAMLSKLYSMLKPGGFLAIADLDKEDGSFHREDTGVFHFGFDRSYLKKIASASGFNKINVKTASTVSKPQGDFPVFLLYAYKPISP